MLPPRLRVVGTNEQRDIMTQSSQKTSKGVQNSLKQ